MINTVQIDDYLSEYGFSVNDLIPQEKDLANETIKQPSLIGYVTKACADAENEYDRAVAELKAESGKLCLSIRKGEVDVGLGKVTEKGIYEYIDCAEELKPTREKLHDAKYALTRWKGVVEQARSKGFSLKSLEMLFSIGYFS